MSGGRVDVAVVGLGPAGRSLASACAARGLRVVAVDPRPDAVWTPTYGVWEDELIGRPSTVVRSRLAAPEVRAVDVHRLSRPYVVLDAAELQAALALDDVDVRRTRLDDAEVAALSSSARVVVDARGAPFTQDSLKGAWSLLYFGFTHCPDICPDELEKVAAVVDALQTEHGVTATPVFISVDPARDAPATVGAYVAEFHPRMVGLTGDEAAVKAAAPSRTGGD